MDGDGGGGVGAVGMGSGRSDLAGGEGGGRSGDGGSGVVRVFVGEVVEEVKALEAGASDVVGKGAEPEVLIARLKAAYRRCCAEGEEPHVYRLSARTTYNSASRRLRTDEEETVLKEKEGVLLHTLCARRGEAVLEEALLKGLWGEGILSKKHSLQNLVSGLR